MSQGLSKIQKNIHRGVLMFGLLAVGWLGVSGTVYAAENLTDEQCAAKYVGKCFLDSDPDPSPAEKVDACTMGGPSGDKARSCWAPLIANCGQVGSCRPSGCETGETVLGVCKTWLPGTPLCCKSNNGFTDDQCKKAGGTCQTTDHCTSGTDYGKCQAAGQQCCGSGGGVGLPRAQCEALNPKGSCEEKSPGSGYINKGKCTDVAGKNCWQKPSDGLTKANCEALNPKGICSDKSPGSGYVDKGLCIDVKGNNCWQAPASGGNCPSQGGECKSDKICTGNKLNTSDCFGPAKPDGGSLVCCVPSSGGDGPSGSTETISFPNPLKFDTFQDLVMGVLAYLQGIIVLLAVVFIVFGGVLYLISGGNEGWIKTAKSAITAAMIGLAIGIGAPTFLREIVTILCTTGGGGAIICPIDQAPIAGAISLWQILINTLNFLLGIAGILAVIMLVIGGGMYLTSAGIDKRIDTGKDIIKNAVLGIIVVLAALVIVRQIASLFV